MSSRRLLASALSFCVFGSSCATLEELQTREPTEAEQAIGAGIMLGAIAAVVGGLWLSLQVDDSSPGDDPAVDKRLSSLRGDERTCATMAGIVNEYDLPTTKGASENPQRTLYGDAVLGTYHRCVREGVVLAFRATDGLPAPEGKNRLEALRYLRDDELTKKAESLHATLAPFAVARTLKLGALKPKADDYGAGTTTLDAEETEAKAFTAMVDAEVARRRADEATRIAGVFKMFDERFAIAAAEEKAGHPLTALAVCASAASPWSTTWTTADDKSGVEERTRRRADCVARLSPEVKKAAAGLAIAVDGRALPTNEREAFMAAAKRAAPATVRLVPAGDTTAAVVVAPRLDGATKIVRGTKTVTRTHLYKSGTETVENPEYAKAVAALADRERCMQTSHQGEVDTATSHNCQPVHRDGCIHCINGDLAVKKNRDELAAAKQRLKWTSKTHEKTVNSEHTYQANEARATATQSWRIELRVGARTEALTGTAAHENIALVHPGNDAVSLVAKNERLDNDATLEQAARTAASTQAAAALPKIAQIAADAIVPAVPASAKPGARAEAALRRAVMLSHGLPSSELKALVGADIGDSASSAFDAALK